MNLDSSFDHKTRDNWIDFISSQEYLWRLMYVQKNTSFIEDSELDLEQIENFLNRLSNPYNERFFLARLHYLSQQNLRFFLVNDLKELLRSATHESRVKTIVSRGGIRGKPIWDKTFYSRVTGRIDKASFITQPLASSFNTPENQLLKLFLNNISQSIEAFITEVGTVAVSRPIMELKEIADAALKQSWLRDVERKYKINALMRLGAQRSRIRQYSKLIFLETEFEEIINETKLEATLNLLRRGWFKPIINDDLFEIYVLFVILSSLKNELGFGEPLSFGLIREGRREVATFHRRTDDVSANVYFDQTPKVIFNVNSYYKHIVDQYEGITAKERRPDIILEFTSPNWISKKVFIECKKSEDGQYMRDSVYKAIAYLRDFENLWNSEELHLPKIIVVFPDKVKCNPSKSNIEELELISIKERERLVELLTIV